MTKIKVTEEGRPNIYIPEKESLIEYIKSLKVKDIHNFIPSGMVILGADHSVKSVIDDINRSDRLGLFTDDSNMGHSLAVITNNRLECFDIGKISINDLIIC
jgi:hypothetical protein